MSHRLRSAGKAVTYTAREDKTAEQSLLELTDAEGRYVEDIECDERNQAHDVLQRAIAEDESSDSEIGAVEQRTPATPQSFSTSPLPVRDELNSESSANGDMDETKLAESFDSFKDWEVAITIRKTTQTDILRHFANSINSVLGKNDGT